MINTREFLPLNVGRQWVLANQQYPDRITTITVSVDSDGAKCLIFNKNHPDTYHGWLNRYLVWRVTEGSGGLYAGNELGTNEPGTEFGPYPDDQRFDIPTGEWRISVWLIGTATGAHILMPWQVRDGQTSVAEDSYASLDYLGNQGYAHQQWNVTWKMVGAQLLLRFDEYTYESNSWIHEDWYLDYGVGIHEISQWNDAARTSLIRRIVRQ